MLEGILGFFAHLKAGAAAGIFVVGATGVLITGTAINGDVRLHVTPAVAVAASPSPSPSTSPVTGATTESAVCVEAVRARDEALRAIQSEKEKALTDLQTLKEIAASLARRANKDLPDQTLTAAQRDVALQLDRVAADAARAVRQVQDLAPCEDGDPATGLVVDLADLRQRYKVVVEQAQQQLRDVLQKAAGLFEKLVREAGLKTPPPASSDSSDSSDSSGG